MRPRLIIPATPDLGPIGGSGAAAVAPAQTSCTFSAEGFDDDLDGMAAGWTAFLDTLRLYLTHFRGRPSVAVSLAGGSPEAKAVAWAAMPDALGLTAPVTGGRGETAEASGAQR